MSSMITVSNGRHCKQIAAADLEKARLEGFDRPFERGETIVGNDRWMFEIPVAELDTTRGSGLNELLSAERAEWSTANKTRDTPHRQRDSNQRALSVNPAIPRGSASDSKDVHDGFSDATVLLTELNQVEQEAAEERLSLESELAATTGWRWYWMAGKLWIEDRREILSRQLRSGGISAALHVAILLILASLFLAEREEPKGLLLAAIPNSDPEIEEVIIEPTPLEITEPIETEQSDTPAEVEVVKNQAFEAPDFVGAVRGDSIEPPAKAVAAEEDGKAMPLKEASFFGKKVTAVNYVFVIDNSNSMTGGRFETALNELMIAVSQLTPRQRFYVIFYSDMAYPMFHPQPASELIPATPRNKEFLRQWLGTVQLCLQTNGKDAIAAAFQLKPDVIFVLGDGAFTDGASKFFASQPQQRIPLHSLGMEVKPKDAADFQRLAEAHGGTYKDVGVSPQAKAFAKANPRPRNTVRGPVWGLKLKLPPPQK